MTGTFIIAEAGVNHNGSVDRALDMVDVAADAGADAIKFQTYVTDLLVTNEAALAAYQKHSAASASSQADMLRKLELGRDAHIALKQRCDQRGIEFLSTPFDSDSASFLVTVIGVRWLKVSSGDLQNAPFLHMLGKLGCGIILSSGMAGLGDIETALGVLAHALAGQGEPSRAAFANAYAADAGQSALRKHVSLLHCTSEYPTPPERVNLRTMTTLAEAFNLRTGFSDHSVQTSVPIAAVALGASIVEKHFTLDRQLEGPDHAASLEPTELAAMIAGIRECEVALGSGVKRITNTELDNRSVAAKGIKAAKAIRQGEILTARDLAVKRPASGRPPIDWWELIGKAAPRDFAAEEPLEW